MARFESRSLQHKSQAYPAPLQASMARWASTYSKFGGPDAFKHAKRVLDVAIAHDVVEPKKIGDNKVDPHELNLRLANIILSHVFRSGRTNRQDFPSEDFERCALVVDGFNTFDALRENDLTQQDKARYGELLERPSLGLLARLVDLTQYGAHGKTSEGELSHLDPSKFYVYDQTRGKTEYEMIGTAARNIYSPLADMLGYRDLSGDLYRIFFQHVEPNAHQEVMQALELLESRIEMTRMVAEAVISQLKIKLKRAGYKYDLKIRPGKHPGKVMEKVDRYKRQCGQNTYQVVSELNDLVAFTVILHSKNGKMITQNDVDDFARVAREIVTITSSIQMLRRTVEANMFTDMISRPKPNGYQSFHVDMPLEGADVVNMEAIIRNGRMEDYAESGGAAHYLYKGGGGLAQKVSAAYQDVKKAILDNGGSILSLSDTSTQRRINVYVEGEKDPRRKIVDERACVGEALIVAGIDLSNGLVLKPNVSLLAPIKGVTSLHLDHSPEKGQMLSRTVIDMLIQKAVYPHVQDTLREYRKKVTR
jgi:ppGpp synthetase/RelA/SpoT-type nucleotidyltranferase